MANVMSVEKRNDILRLLCEGNSIRSITRLMGTNINTVLRQLHWAAGHCQALMDERFNGLKLGHVEVDEMWTFCGTSSRETTTLLEGRAARSCGSRGGRGQNKKGAFLWH